MKIVVCLGNPGDKYRFTRHNAGFMVADFIAAAAGAKWEKRGNMLSCTVESLLLVKPQTFMNNSGEIFLCLPEMPDPEDVLAVVDEVNLPLGKMRFRAGGSAGGHNGLSSLEVVLGTQDFQRLRIGVGGNEAVSASGLIDFVLGDFAEGETQLLHKIVELSSEAVLYWAREGVLRSQDKYNGMDLRDPVSGESDR